MHQNACEIIPIDLIDDPDDLLRPVDQRGVEYLELKQSIADNGILNSILVRPHNDRYQVVDGRNRLTVARQLGHTTIAASIKPMSDSELLILQLETAVCRVETKFTYIVRRIERLLQDNPEWSLQDISTRIHKSPAWIKQRLSLLHLEREYQKLIDDGKLSVKSASLLVKLPPDERPVFIKHALTLTTTEFAQLAGPVAKQYREDVFYNRRNALVGPMTPLLRSVTTIQKELDEPTVAGPLTILDECETPIDGFMSGLRWVLRLDQLTEQTRKVLQVRLEADRVKNSFRQETIDE